MKRFTVPCDFSDGQRAPFHLYVGEPAPDLHPLRFQSAWLESERGGTVPRQVMDSFERLHKIALENNVSFEDLCVYALGNEAEQSEPAEVREPPTGSDVPPESPSGG